VVAAAGCVALPLHAYIQIYFQAGQDANEIAKPHVSINPHSSATDCKNLQPEIEIATGSNEYSSSKNTQLANYSNSTRVLEYSTRGSTSDGTVSKSC